MLDLLQNPHQVPEGTDLTWLFSRNGKLLSAEHLRNSCAVIVGVGSVGSYAALELARAGVGFFWLIDPDSVGVENISRHQCGLSDVGRPKVQAVADRVYDINPNASVYGTHGSLFSIAEEEWDFIAQEPGQPMSVIVACADDRAANAYASNIARSTGVPFAAIALYNNAAVGEVWWQRADGNDSPCYGCAMSDMLGYKAERVEFYVREGAEERIKAYTPGLSADITHVASVGVQVVLDLLCEGDEGYAPTYTHEAGHLLLVCNSNQPERGGQNVVAMGLEQGKTYKNINGQFGKRCPPCLFTVNDAEVKHAI